MSENEAHADKHVHLVATRAVQNTCFLSFLNEQMRASLHTSLEEAFSLVALDPETTALVLIDVNYIGLDRVLEELSGLQFPDSVSCALLNVNRDAPWGAECVLHGIRGLFFEDDSLELLRRGISAMLEGSVWISRETLLAAAVHPHQGRNGDQPYSALEQLTRREKEILGLICIGATNQEIADKLFISTNTVKTHIYKIYKKIDVPNRMQAALWGAKNL